MSPSASSVASFGSSEALPTSGPLQSAGPNVWTANSTGQMMSSSFPMRMTVLGLPDKKRDGKKRDKKTGIPNLDLLVYSPFDPTEQLVSEIKALGTVTYIVAPNAFHNTWAGAFKAAFPDAKLIAPASVKDKRPDLAIDFVFPELPKNWPANVVSLMSVPLVGEELVLVHKPSRALVLADLAFNFVPGGETPLPSGLLMKAYLTLTGGYKPCSLTLPFKALIADATATEAALEKVLMQDFDQLIMGHGSIVTTGAKEALTQGTLAFVKGVVQERAIRAQRRELIVSTYETLRTKATEKPYLAGLATTGLVVLAAGTLAVAKRK